MEVRSPRHPLLLVPSPPHPLREPRRSTARIQAVTFDVGGTLVDPRPSAAHIYAAVAAEHGYPNLNVKVLGRNFASAWAARKRFRYTRTAWARIVDLTFGNLVTPRPSRSFFPVIYERFANPDAWHLYADVRPTLRMLRARNLRLGIISNWDDRLRPLLDRLQLTDGFAAIVISHEAGSTKPHRPIFEQAARQLQCDPSSILHVGDSPHEDYAGARAAGFRAVLLQRKPAPTPSPRETVRSLRGVLRYLTPGVARVSRDSRGR